MRTIQDIRNEITTAFMANETLAEAYGFPVGSSFDDHFSKSSITGLIVYIVAFSIWSLEKIFDIHKDEVNSLIDNQKPHTLRWYRNKALAFQYGRPLPPDSDTYDQVVGSEMIVRYAAAVEYQGKLYIKVAKGETEKQPLSGTEQAALEAYFAEIKDAGVKLEVINKPADHIRIDVDIYYDPMVISPEGLSLATGDDVVRNAIRDFVQNRLPFNGEYRNADLVDALQSLPGVVIPELKAAKTIPHDDYPDGSWIYIQAMHRPVSGYYKIYNDDDLNIRFIAYQFIESV